MEHDVQPFTSFVPGNHLVLGAAGVGKTRLIWSLLQSKEFCGTQTVNLVLTDHAKPLWQFSSNNPVVHIDPYSNDMSWIASPDRPGIYYAACDYLPRMLTFVECLANYARSTEAMQHPVRVFLDFPTKFWRKTHFLDQIDRLLYISESADSENPPLEVWMVLSAGADLPSSASNIFSRAHRIVLNPLSKSVLETTDQLCQSQLPLADLSQDTGKDTGFYYLPHNLEQVYFKNCL